MSPQSYLLRFSVLFLMFSPSLLFSQDKVVLDSLHVQLNHAKEDSTKVKVLWALSEYQVRYDLPASLEYVMSAMEVAKESKDPILIATSYTYLLRSFFQMGNFNEALKNGLEALKIYEDLGKENDLFKVYQNLGVVFEQMKEYDKALDYYFKALSIYNNISSENKPALRRKMPQVFNCIGGVYQTKKDYNTALQYYTKALGISKEFKQDAILGMIYNNLGKLSMNLGKENEALNYFNLSLQHREKINDLNGMARTYLFEGIYFMEIGEYDQALDMAKKAKNLIELIGRKGLELDLELLFFNIYQAKKEYQKALTSHIRYKELDDSHRSEANLKEQVSLQLQYEFDKKEKIREAEKQKMKFKYGLIISVLTLVCIIIGLFYNLAKNHSKRVTLEKEHVSLEKKNLEQDLELKNKELTTNVMYLLQKNELINSISSRLLQLKKKLNKENQEGAQRIIFDLQAGADRDVWDEFETRFLQVHNEFYLKLKEICTSLTPSEVKLCAFLRLNMTSKEISAITHQSVKSIEVARARVRKKLDLTGKDVNLVTFLSELEG